MSEHEENRRPPAGEGITIKMAEDREFMILAKFEKGLGWKWSARISGVEVENGVVRSNCSVGEPEHCCACERKFIRATTRARDVLVEYMNSESYRP